jgi:iron complex transport system permease protein
VRRPRLAAAVAAGLALLAATAGCLVGSVPLDLGRLAAALVGQPVEPADAVILFDLRLPRVALAGAVGAALALSGAALQGLFRNPLADPSVLGVSAGGALGAAVALTFSLGPPPLLAFAGALGAALLVYALARGGDGLSVTGVLLAGVAVGLTLGALLTLVLLAARERAPEIYLWLLGHLAGRGWSAVIWVGGAVIAGGGALLLLARALDVLALGAGVAAGLGVRVGAVRLAALAAAALLVAAASAFCGLIGFVGLLVPHAARFATGPRHAALLPVAALGGAATLISADLVARAALPFEVPVGVVTGALGGPLFLALLRRHLRPAGSGPA